MCDGLKNIELQEMNITERKIGVMVNGRDGNFSLPIDITFPTAYPHSALPGFTIHPVTTGAIQVDINVLKRIREKLVGRAEDAVKKHSCCLSLLLREASILAEECIQVVQTVLVQEIQDGDEQMDVDDDDSSDAFSTLLEADGTLKDKTAEIALRKAGLYHKATDNRAARQPCPRLCGAAFSPTGKLVCFTIKVIVIVEALASILPPPTWLCSAKNWQPNQGTSRFALSTAWCPVI